MKLLSFTMPETFNLYQWGDDHEGTIFQLTHAVEDLIGTIADDPIGYSFHVGDWSESRAIDHPYYSQDTAKTGSKTPLAQLFKARDKYKPLSIKKDKFGNKGLLWINKGNHEASIDNYGSSTEALCNELGVNYGTWTAKPTFLDKKERVMFKGYFCHGFDRGHTLSSQAQDPKLQKAHSEMKLKKMLYPMAGDAIIMGCGHYHKLVVNSPSQELYLTDDQTKIHQGYTQHTGSGFIHQDLRWYVCSGAFYRQFLDGQDSYAEKKGLRPTELGYIKITVQYGNITNVEPIRVS